MTKLATGQTIALPKSTHPAQRIIAAISWDQRYDDIKTINRLIHSDSQHDLDIACYVYDTQGEFVDYISAEAQDSMDQSGHIYHSGDDMSGEGDGDDEHIEAELGNLPDDIGGLIFLVEIKSNHVFGDIENPAARLFDTMSREVLCQTAIAENSGEKESIAWVFAALKRTDREPSGWTLTFVNDYPDITQVSDWGSFLGRYLR